MNNIEEFNYINKLYDLYKSILTKKQASLIEKYYLLNLSLSEISEELNISRSAVSDAVKNAREKLENYEDKLHILSKNEKIKEILKNSNIDEDIKKKILEVLYYGI
ncbi:MAG: sigma factor-like helix-turn-helix DNA-binding protein [Bacilli bacterium]